ncbi:MAG: O-antigen ligase family protein, partial [Syntrophomonadaceae bacterium]|nr:O-antigen ligase family protein [Syntrophomonadaceae bacterium]
MRIISSENKIINESKGYSKRSLLHYLFVGGLLAALYIAPFLRGLYFEQELLPIIMLVALSFACCVGEWLFQRDAHFFNHPLDWAMLALVMVYLLSLINAVNIHQALLAILSVASFFMVYWMAGQAIKNESDFNRLLIVVYLMAIGLSMVGMGAAAGLVELSAAYEDGHIRSALQYHNTLAIYLAGLSFAGLALSIRSERKISRLAYAAGNLILVMAIIGTISRGTWLIYPLGFMLFIILIGKQHRREALLNWAIFFFCGLVAGLGFLNKVSQGQETSALIFAAAGLLAAAFMQWLADSIKFADKSGEGQKNLYCIAGRPQLVVAGLVLTAGLIYMLLSFWGSSTQFVPREISAKVEKTSLQDNSINDRLTFYQDALKIAVDYPLLGAGGGGWEALYHSYAQRLYWSREVHSYYLQTLVETGILGLLTLLVIAALFIKLLIDQRQRDKAGSLSNMTLWGTATAVIMFGMHSGMDADFSLPSTGLLFYALVGAIKGRTMDHAPAGSERKKPKEKNKSRKRNSKEIFGLLGITVALIVFGGVGMFRQAAILGEAGAQALEKRDVDRAAILYQKAAKLDPWRATYQINLAKIAAIKADKNQDDKARVTAKGYA